MHRFPLGRGRWLAGASAVVMLIGCVLPWYTVGGTIGGLPPYTGNAFESTGILVFLAALSTLALVALPYAAGDRPLALDRWLVYLIILVVAVIGYALRLVDILSKVGFQLPDNAPGLWLVAIGLIGLARATYEIAQTQERR